MAVVMRSVASVCVSVCAVRAVTFESFDLRNFIFGTWIHLQNT